MSENDLWNMISREDQELNGRHWSREMFAQAGSSIFEVEVIPERILLLQHCLIGEGGHNDEEPIGVASA